MSEETLRRIEAAIKSIEAGSSPKRPELLGLLKTLKTEVEGLAGTHGEQAHSIAGYAAVAAYEASRKQKAQDMLDHSVSGLSLSVEGFEASHPKLVETVNNICTMLAGIGV